MQLSIVIPAYNEEKKIEKDVQAARSFLAESGVSGEIVVVDDGSVDGTKAMVQKHFENSDVPVRLISYRENQGKGHAVKRGMLESQGRVAAFVDAGLCVPYSYLLNGLKAIEAGADVAIGTRRHPAARILARQPLYRRWGSQIFWLVARFVMGVSASDTQCGFKLYSREAVKLIFPRLKTKGFMFDIETLLLAGRLGLKVSEFPVDWANDSDTRYRPIRGTLRNFKELVRIRLRAMGGI